MQVSFNTKFFFKAIFKMEFKMKKIAATRNYRMVKTAVARVIVEPGPCGEERQSLADCEISKDWYTENKHLKP